MFEHSNLKKENDRTSVFRLVLAILIGLAALVVWGIYYHENEGIDVKPVEAGVSLSAELKQELPPSSDTPQEPMEEIVVHGRKE